MYRTTISATWVAAFLSLIVSAGIPAQKQADPKRVAAEIAKSKAGKKGTKRALAESLERLYAELLEAIGAEDVNARRDGLRTLLDKRAAIRQALAQFSGAVMKLVLDQRAIGMDHARFAADTFPRLSGRVVRVGGDSEIQDLDKAEIDAGDLVLLGEGNFILPKRTDWRDVSIRGLGIESTTLTGQIGAATRLRLANLRFDCKNDPCIDLRRGGSVHVSGCYITNYNSGAGGSNAVSGSDTILLIEDSVFEGKTGRAHPRKGDALDLRGTNMLYVRKTKFVDNDEIIRALSLCVFDRCSSVGTDDGIYLYPSGTVLVRDNRAKIRGEASAEFTHATDDPAVVHHLLGRKSDIDEETADAAEQLELGNNLRYWATLLQHDNREIIFAAQGKLTSLLRKEMPKLKVAPKLLTQVKPKERRAFEARLRSSAMLFWIEDNEAELQWDPKRRIYVRERR